MRGAERILLAGVLGSLAVFAATAKADGVVIDAIYHPYVHAGEQELEWRATWQDGTPALPGDVALHRLSYGRAVNERWFLEAYLVGEDREGQGLDVEAVEVEALRQLTEQGEYWADWGLLLELEQELDLDVWEAAVGVIAEKEWGRWSTTANLSVIQEWGSDIDDEIETRLALQARYRYRPAVEPAVEFHAGEDTRALGPALAGRLRLDAGRQLAWSAAWLFGLDADSPDQAVRVELEFEF